MTINLYYKSFPDLKKQMQLCVPVGLLGHATPVFSVFFCVFSFSTRNKEKYGLLIAISFIVRVTKDNILTGHRPKNGN